MNEAIRALFEQDAVSPIPKKRTISEETRRKLSEAARKPRKRRKRRGRPPLPETLLRKAQIRERKKYQRKKKRIRAANTAAFHARVEANRLAKEERAKRWAVEQERRRVKREFEALQEVKAPVVLGKQNVCPSLEQKSLPRLVKQCMKVVVKPGEMK